ncbi:WD repeat-containing protein 91 [Plutella xylostella]|uniref:WD repeat-containing protein 91 n=1 Tax=Plutella xylostella TaxID=51655 RepID=UPI0005D07D06|nr:WD repeat-containing protein 91 [Plutella xylostella]
MAHIQFVDELVREYLLYRGFTSTLKSFDNDLKADKDKGFRVDKIIEQILHFINVSDLNGLKEYWSHLDNFVFSKLEIHFQPAIRKMEYSLYKLYLVTAVQGNGGVKNERVTEFLSKMLPELQGQNEWKEWFMLPYIQKPEENLSFSLYFTRSWQDSVLVSLHNLLATVFQCMPQPTLTSYESDAAMVKRLQDELATLRLQSKMQPQPPEKTSPIGHQSRLAQYSERLSGPLPLVDDFCAVPSEHLDSGAREAKGLRGLIRQMGGSPVMGRKTSRSQSQN